MRVDIAVSRADGQEVFFVEVKSGPTARLTSNQRLGYTEISAIGGTPVGERAFQAGFFPGLPIGPTRVIVVRRP